MDIDLLGSFNASRLAFEQLKRKRGIDPVRQRADGAYPARPISRTWARAKAGVEMLMKNLGLNGARSAFAANSIIPGLVPERKVCGAYSEMAIRQAQSATIRSGAWEPGGYRQCGRFS